jgi:hypothetical protein
MGKLVHFRNSPRRTENTLQNHDNWCPKDIYTEYHRNHTFFVAKNIRIQYHYRRQHQHYHHHPHLHRRLYCLLAIGSFWLISMVRPQYKSYVDATVLMIFLASLNLQSVKYSVYIPTTVSNIFSYRSRNTNI